jgi:hypothetical protein
MVFGIIPERRSDSFWNERSASPESPEDGLEIGADTLRRWMLTEGTTLALFSERETTWAANVRSPNDDELPA